MISAPPLLITNKKLLEPDKRKKNTHRKRGKHNDRKILFNHIPFPLRTAILALRITLTSISFSPIKLYTRALSFKYCVFKGILFNHSKKHPFIFPRLQNIPSGRTQYAL
ncbi:hypothetical protein RH08_02640 [Candidatus Liberibacter asiaticus]|uniref:Uncharacterized protein n=3 Tax=Liberibacter asiaticus TaxID=34021 RepID=C6XFJ8_LIBAP|nr:hypothetical protein [Candidatus Liberibacter asiaticus]ACT57151.1 hypothetical protein CLIBASIA_02825 [Candidatus Liberibacter asiaticus str. psy62]AGH16885.1 hypothetical protein WSI_02575 [Candidatus Liberibacter asiaticus str. gxpsy]ALK07238.1 hypothetical protein CD16_02605 [Candidatus Liberibacter asiaticus]ASK52723.1 hypothetical protein B2I23_02645 [Candidatus Liberibacter asiaticus]AWL14046.1 hypothetical protein DIC79_02670 [Candidatus Liberibacter asiaticus]